jgi:hypothetical protein
MKNVSIVVNVLLIAAAVVWILARQVRVTPVKPRLLWLVPLILAFFGIRSLPSSTWHVPADLWLLAVSAVISIGLGIWRGQTIRVWRDEDGTWWRQGSVLTLILWGALIVARGLIYGIGVGVHHREATNLGAILVVLALSFAAQNAVTALRMNAAQPLSGAQPTAPAAHNTAIPPQLATHDGLHARRHERIEARRQERRERRETRSWE